ncbi:MAG: helix-hairpin-helix domain-containing protein [Candidatus Marsarchaeota archaeon]|jgi:ERCC4-type nuclease|nr:helix-hairpin-helix domain-containing protein [Candidatus Marsarchaeota archaeon]
MPAPQIVVDQRERNAELLSGLEGLGAVVTLRTVPVGDYIVSSRICVERKTVRDFESSLISGRLFDQASRLREAYEFPMLLLEGQKSDFLLRRRSITGAIVALYVRFGICVIESESIEETASLLVSIAAQEQDTRERLPSVKGAARARSGAESKEAIVANIPGIGPKLARSLLRRFGSVRAIAEAGTAELTCVDKIGAKKAALIRSTLNELYQPAETV